MSRLIEVENLTLEFKTDEGLITAVDDVSFTVGSGEVMGLVGESGSGKSVTAKSLMKLNPRNGVYSDQSRINLFLDNQSIDIMSLTSEAEMQIIRGGAISMIFQEPMASFAPAITIGDQMVEQLLIHTKLSKRQARDFSIDMLTRVGISDAAKRFKQYAFELSGGMRQRAMIAMALSTKPKLLIADEPTTALDVTIQAQVIDLMKDLVAEFGMGIIFITHDLGVVAQTCDSVAVMYLGRLVEKGPRPRCHPQPATPLHPRPARRPAETRRSRRPPHTRARRHPLAARTAFGLRLPHTLPRCHPGTLRDHRTGLHPARRTPQGRLPPGIRKDRCPMSTPTAGPMTDSANQQANLTGDQPASHQADKPLITARDLSVHFPLGGGLFGKRASLKAVDGVNIDIERGSFFGLVGESGSGKTTLGRALLKANPISRGTVEYNDGEVSYQLETIDKTELKDYRKRAQLIFQDPYAALSPRMTVRDIIAEPLEVMKLTQSREQTDERVRDIAARCRLNLEHLRRFPHAFSGGQRQRISIARALVSGPRFVVADESVAALDVSIQADVLNLLKQLQQDLGLTFLFISHDLSVVAHICDHVAVMYLGRLVETAPTRELFKAPRHPYTKALLSAIPSLDPDDRGKAQKLEGEIPSPTNPPPGCKFSTRCPFAIDICRREEPRLQESSKEHDVACHRWQELATADAA